MNSFTQSSLRKGWWASQPGVEAAVAVPHVPDAPGVVDDRVDFQPVADDPGIGQQARAVGLAESRHPVHLEPGEGRVNASRFFSTVSQDRPA